MIILLVFSLLLMNVSLAHADSDNCQNKPVTYFEDYKYLKKNDAFRECLVNLHGEVALHNITIKGITKLNISAYELSLDLAYTHPNLIDSKMKHALIIAMRDDPIGVLNALKKRPSLIFIPCGLSQELSYEFSILSISERMTKLDHIISNKELPQNIIQYAKICSLFLDYSLFENNQYDNFKRNRDQFCQQNPSVPNCQPERDRC